MGWAYGMNGDEKCIHDFNGEDLGVHGRIILNY